MMERSPQPLPDDVRNVVTRYLQLADSALPGVLKGLYLVGSLALGDYKPGKSDADFVAVSDQPLTGAELDRIDAVHSTLRTEFGGPSFDGIYVRWQDLGRSPEEAVAVASSHEGQLQRAGGFEANPVTWLILQRRPLPLRGPAPEVWHDSGVTRRWTIDNLNSYWLRIVSEVETAAGKLSAERMAEAIAWCVPGVARLAYTVATGDVISKSGACRYALAQYPERWHPIVRYALAIRNDTTLPEPPSSMHLRDTAEFMRYVIRAANAVTRGRGGGEDGGFATLGVTRVPE